MAKPKSRKHLQTVENQASPAPAEDGNGNGKAKSQTYEIGSSIPVPPEAIAQIEALLGQISNVHQQIGLLTEDFEVRRSVLLRTLAQARNVYTERVKRLGIDLGLNLGQDSNESWLFNPKEKTFTRQA